MVMIAALLLQAAAIPAPPADADQHRYQCQLAEQRLAQFSAEWQARLTRQIRKRRDMLRFRQISEQIAQPYLEDVRVAMQEGDPGWVCDRIAQQGIDVLKRDAIQPIFGDEP